MTLIGTDLLRNGGSFKAVINEQGAYFFPTNQQHCDMKFPGLSYDNSQGNALAAIFIDGRCEIRGHDHFSVERVRAIWESLLRQPELVDLRKRQVSYAGKAL